MVSNPELYDTHCHLDFSEFEGSHKALLESCCQDNITKLLVPSVAKASWEKLSQLVGRHAGLSYALGLHPLFIGQHSLSDLDELRNLIANKPDRLVALGEIGLDADAANKAFQEELFAKQLGLAADHNLPVIMHARRTHSQILSHLKKVKIEGVIHAFSGGEELLKQYLTKGIRIGVGCVITWPSAKRTRKSIANAPIDSLLLETDSPDMRVYGGKDKAFGTPLAVRQVFSTLCKIRPESPDVLAEALRDNADRMFFNRG